MAKIFHPLKSDSASGIITDEIVHFSKRGTSIARVQLPKKDRKSIAQQEQRKTFNIAREKWNTLTTSDRYAWLARARDFSTEGFVLPSGKVYGRQIPATKYPRTGYNTFLSKVISSLRKGEEWNTVRNVTLTRVDDKMYVSYSLEFPAKSWVRIGSIKSDDLWYTRYLGKGPLEVIGDINEDITTEKTHIIEGLYFGEFYWCFQVFTFDGPYGESGWYFYPEWKHT